MAHLEKTAGRYPREIQEEGLMEDEHRFDYWVVSAFFNGLVNGSLISLVWLIAG